jgi:hypothetical protein
MHPRHHCLVFILTAALVLPALAAAQAAGTEPATAPANSATSSASTAQADDPDKDVDFAQPDFTLVGLPTTLRLPKFGSAFRVTHRFARPLGDGDFGSLLEDFFGLDAGAQIGLEYRFGIFRGAQVGIHRTSDRTIQFFGQYDIRNERGGFPLGLAAIATAEGTNNFRDSYSPALGLIVSKALGRHGAVYAEPIWVNNTNALPSDLADDNSTFMIGVGARIRVRPTVYGVVEWSPRVAGYEPGDDQVSFGVEKRAGGHTFQLNFSNGFGTTLGQIARGGSTGNDWYLGFNISRKFY